MLDLVHFGSQLQGQANDMVHVIVAVVAQTAGESHLWQGLSQVSIGLIELGVALIINWVVRLIPS